MILTIQRIDNLHYINLPEGVSLTLTPAGVACRTYAYLIDLAIRAVVFLLLAIALNMIGVSGTGISLVLLFAVNWCYYIWFEGRTGTSPGKNKLQLRVVQDNGLPASFSNIILRNLLRAVDCLPFAYALGLITMLSNGQFKRLGDWAAGTLVIYQPPPTTLPAINVALPYIPAEALTTAEQAAILEFVNRSTDLSVERQLELAKILTPWLGDDAELALTRLQRMASYYAGNAA